MSIVPSVCGVCSSSFAYCPNHLHLSEPCDTDNCSKRLCKRCTRKISTESELGRVLCREHGKLCRSCNCKLDSTNWRQCEICEDVECIHRCPTRGLPIFRPIFPSKKHNVCQRHFVSTGCSQEHHETPKIATTQCSEDECETHCCEECHRTHTSPGTPGARGKKLFCPDHRATCDKCGRYNSTSEMISTNIIIPHSTLTNLCPWCWAKISGPLDGYIEAITEIGHVMPPEVQYLIAAELHKIT